MRKSDEQTLSVADRLATCHSRVYLLGWPLPELTDTAAETAQPAGLLLPATRCAHNVTYASGTLATKTFVTPRVNPKTLGEIYFSYAGPSV